MDAPIFPMKWNANWKKMHKYVLWIWLGKGRWQNSEKKIILFFQESQYQMLFFG